MRSSAKKGTSYEMLMWRGEVEGVVSEKSTACAVIVTVDASEHAMREIEAHARLGLARFPDYTGFISGALQISADRTRLVQYLQWQSEGDHRRCIDDPMWDDLPSTKRFMELVDSGAASMDLRVYDVVATAPTNAADSVQVRAQPSEGKVSP